PSAETWNYTYDNRNQMTGVEECASDGGSLLLKVTYTYDVFNNRVQEDKWTSGGSTITTKFAFGDIGVVWADLGSTNALQTRYLYSDSQHAPMARISSGGSVAWVLVDRLGCVRNVTDASGTLISTVVYDGYGKITSETSATNTGRFAYTGLAQDRDTGLVH